LIIPAENNDLNNSPRGFDVPTVNNTYDSGACEYSPQIIFKMVSSD